MRNMAYWAARVGSVIVSAIFFLSIADYIYIYIEFHRYASLWPGQVTTFIPRLGQPFNISLPSLILPTAVGPVAYIVLAFHKKRHLRAERLRNGLCVYCGYPLIGISSTRCPECGSGRQTALAGPIRNRFQDAILQRLTLRGRALVAFHIAAVFSAWAFCCWTAIQPEFGWPVALGVAIVAIPLWFVLPKRRLVLFETAAIAAVLASLIFWEASKVQIVFDNTGHITANCITLSGEKYLSPFKYPFKPGCHLWTKLHWRGFDGPFNVWADLADGTRVQGHCAKRGHHWRITVKIEEKDVKVDAD